MLKCLVFVSLPLLRFVVEFLVKIGIWKFFPWNTFYAVVVTSFACVLYIVHIIALACWLLFWLESVTGSGICRFVRLTRFVNRFRSIITISKLMTNSYINYSTQNSNWDAMVDKVFRQDNMSSVISIFATLTSFLKILGIFLEYSKTKKVSCWWWTIQETCI